MPNVIPTKGNLMALKRSQSLAFLGFDLMDRKRNILIREMMSLIDVAGVLQEKIDSTFRTAYTALQMANMTLGNCDAIAHAVSADNSIQIRSRSIMGVELPTVTIEQASPTIPYGFAFSNSMLDDAFIHFTQVKRLVRELAEVETTIYRLAYNIKKTQKRANALQNIIIPNFASDIKFITEALEEKDREEFVRNKVIKGQKKR